MALLALVTSLVTRWRHLHSQISLDCPIDIISIEFVSLSARVMSVESQQGVGVTDHVET